VTLRILLNDYGTQGLETGAEVQIMGIRASLEARLASGPFTRLALLPRWNFRIFEFVPRIYRRIFQSTLRTASPVKSSGGLAICGISRKMN
jgi:hypothetical protein